MNKEAMKLALEALEGLEALLLSMGLTHLIVYGDAEKAITNLQKQLEEQLAQRKPLTDEEILDATCHLGGWNIDVARCVINHARAIEAAHGIKGDA